MGFVKNVAMREEQLYEKSRNEDLNGALSNIWSAIDAETDTRLSEDNRLMTYVINFESDVNQHFATLESDTSRAYNDITLAAYNESTLREKCESDISVSLSNFIDNCTSSISANLSYTIDCDTAIVRYVDSQTSNLYDTVTERINSEVAVASSARTTLYNQLSSEVAKAYANATLAAHNEVTLEAYNRTQAVNNATLAAHNEVTLEAYNRTQAVNNSNAAIAQLRADVPTLISNFEGSTTTKDGTKGLVPAPPKKASADTKMLLTSDGWENIRDVDIYIGAVPSQARTQYYADGAVVNAEWNNYESTKLSIGGAYSGTKASVYSAQFKPLGLHCWSDGNRDVKAVNWTISPLPISIPAASNTLQTYTGSNITVNVSNFDSNHVNRTGTYFAANSGTYHVTYSLKDTANLTWTDKTVAAKVINWGIASKKITKPTAADTNYNYSGATVTLGVANYDSVYMNRTGTYFASNVGTYHVTYSLKDSANTKWTDNSSANVVIDWNITSSAIPKPAVTNSPLTYNGLSQDVLLSNVDDYSDYVTLLGGTTRAIDAGTYALTYGLRNTVSSFWDDNSKNPVTLNWVIKRKNLSAEQSNLYQATPITYNGNSHNVTLEGGITNFDATYHSITGGSVTGTAAGTYSLSIAPKSNFAWSNGTSSVKTVNWIIGASGIAKPYADVTSFEYTGSTINLHSNDNVHNYDSNYMTRTGTYSAVDKGNYHVTYTLKDSSNIWSGGGTSPAVIDWNITGKVVPLPSVTSGDFTYSGASKKPTVTGYNSTYMATVGTASATNAGTYHLTYSLKDTVSSSWSTGGTNPIVLDWIINRKPLTATQSNVSIKSSSDITYDGTQLSLTTYLANYNPTYHLLSGTLTGTAAKTYGASVVPTDNYMWNSNTYEKKSLDWTIKRKVLTKPSFVGKSSFAYDGATHEVTISSDYNSAWMTQTGVTSGSAKKDYHVYFALNDTVNTWWDDSTTAKLDLVWNIGANPVDKPVRTDSQKFTYDGNSKSIEVANYDSDVMTFSGKISGIDAKSYAATYALKDKTNYCWADGTTANVVINWNIARATLTAAQSTGFAQAVPLTYNGTNQAVSITNFDSSLHYMIGEGSATYSTGSTKDESLAGDYVVKITTGAGTSQHNYCWANGTTETINVPWTIDKLSLEKPYISYVTTVGMSTGYSDKPTTKTFSYKGTIYTCRAKPPYINSAYVDIDLSDNVTLSSDNSSYDTFKAKEVGTYSLTYSLKDTINTCWSDNTTSNKIISVIIQTGDGIAKPAISGSNEIEWSGGNVSPVIDNVDTSLMTKTSGSDTAVNIGTYSITYALKNKTSTKWSDGTTNDVTLTWYVVRKNLDSIGAAKMARYLNKDMGEFKNLTYNGDEQVPSYWYNQGGSYITSDNLTDYYDFSSQTSATNAGTYTLQVQPKSTYCWSDGTYGKRSYQWIIEPKRLTKPTLSGSPFTYDGNSKSITVNNFNSTYENKAGSDTAVNAGTYTLDFTLKSTSNTTWADSSTSKVSLNWIIDKASPTLTPAQSTVSLDKTTTSTTVSLTYTGDGNLSVASIGTDTATASIANKIVTIKPKWRGQTYLTVQAAATSNYTAKECRITINSNYIPPLKDCTFEQIQSVAKTSDAADYWDIGDYKEITINGTVGVININGTYRMTLIGINHKHNVLDDVMAPTLTFMVNKKNSALMFFVDDNYGQTSTDGTPYFQHNPNGYQCPYYQGTNGRVYECIKAGPNSSYNYNIPMLDRCDEFFAALPSDLQAVIARTVHREEAYLTKTGSLTELSENTLTPISQDLVFIPTYKELTGTAYGNDDNSTQFEYFANGGTSDLKNYWLNKGGDNISAGSGAYRYIWTRSIKTDFTVAGTRFVNLVASSSGVSPVAGSSFGGYHDHSYGFLPCFSIG